MCTRVVLRWLITLGALGGLCSATIAQPRYPAKPIRVIVPYTPGGADAQIRALAPLLGARLGQPLVIENIPGAGGIIATNQVKNAAPDGYTLFFTGTAGLTMVPNMNKEATFRISDFIPIGNMTGTATIMVVRAELPFAQDVVSFRAFAKVNPGKINFGSAGNGTLTHILGALVMYTGDLSFTHVPFKGSADVVQAMLSGTVDMLLGLPSNALTHIRSGKMRALTSSGAARSEFFPDTPTMREAGFDFVDLSRFGIFAPRGLPEPIVQSLATAVEESVKSVEYVEAMRKLTTSVLHHPPAEYRKILEDEDRRWRTLLVDPKFTAAMQ